MKSMIKRLMTQAGIEPVAWRQHVEVSENGSTPVREFRYYDIKIMQGDDPLYTHDQMIKLCELVAKEWAKQRDDINGEIVEIRMGL